MRFTSFFEFGPYVTVAAFVVGLVARHSMTGRGASAPGDVAHVRSLNGASLLWRATLVTLIAAHLAGLMIPRLLLLWNRVPLRLYVLEATGFAVGIVVLLGCLVATWRHLSRPSASILQAVGDSLFLSATLLAVATGLLTAGLYRWGSNWSVVTLTPYMRSLSQGHVSIRSVTSLPFAVQLHVVSGLAVVALFPISSIARSVLVVLPRPLTWLGKPLASRVGWVDAWVRRHNPAAWVWPEED